MGFTFILYTNTFLVGRYWDFKGNANRNSLKGRVKLERIVWNIVIHNHSNTSCCLVNTTTVLVVTRMEFQGKVVGVFKKSLLQTNCYWRLFIDLKVKFLVISFRATTITVQNVVCHQNM